jgi:hypothetical protein
MPWKRTIIEEDDEKCRCTSIDQPKNANAGADRSIDRSRHTIRIAQVNDGRSRQDQGRNGLHHRIVVCWLAVGFGPWVSDLPILLSLSHDGRRAAKQMARHSPGFVGSLIGRSVSRFSFHVTDVGSGLILK